METFLEHIQNHITRWIRLEFVICNRHLCTFNRIKRSFSTRRRHNRLLLILGPLLSHNLTSSSKRECNSRSHFLLSPGIPEQVPIHPDCGRPNCLHTRHHCHSLLEKKAEGKDHDERQKRHHANLQQEEQVSSHPNIRHKDSKSCTDSKTTPVVWAGCMRHSQTHSFARIRSSLRGM